MEQPTKAKSIQKSKQKEMDAATKQKWNNAAESFLAKYSGLLSLYKKNKQEQSEQFDRMQQSP